MDDAAIVDAFGPAIGNFSGDNSKPQPQVRLPLTSSLEGLIEGVATFTRATSATFIDDAGILQTVGANVSRHTSKGILIEGAATDIGLFSGDMGNADHNRQNITIDDNAAISPDGELTAARFNVNATNAVHTHLNSPAYTQAINTDHACAYDLKNDGIRYMQLRTYYATNDWACIVVDLTDGSITDFADSGSTTLSNYGVVALADGWYRPWIASQDSANTDELQFVLDGSGSPTPTRDPSGGITYLGVEGEDCFFDNRQVEVGSFPSSYIETGASPTQRNADDLTYPAAGNVDNFPQTISIKATSLAPTGAIAQFIFSISNGSTDERVDLLLASGRPRLLVSTGGVLQTNITAASALTAGVESEIVVNVGEDDVELFVDGVSVGSDSSASMPTPSVLSIGSNSVQSSHFNGYLRDFRAARL